MSESLGRAADPPFESVQAWARAYIESTDLAYKTDPPSPPGTYLSAPEPLDLRPGRPPALRVTKKRAKSIKRGALERPEVRARLHHKFWSHELQAAELMCWALLRFPDAPEDFQRGLLRIHRDEVRHMKMYQTHIEGLGYGLDSFPVRDWFWERVPSCTTKLQFVALLGMGLEGANLDHTQRFARWLREAGDEEGAALQERVGREEIAHVRFATRWFRVWAGDVTFSAWSDQLPPPLSPLLMRGTRVARSAREKAEFSPEFLDALSAFQPEPRSRAARA